MQLTTENIDTALEDAGLLIVARPGDDGNVHLGKLHPHETVTYTVPCTYNDTDTLVFNLGSLERGEVAVVRKFPNRQTAQYLVKFGEIL